LSVDFTELVAILRRRWKTIVSLTLLATLIGAGLSVASDPVYESSANVYVTSDSSNAQEAFASSMYATQRVASYADLANHRVLMSRVIDELDLEDTSPTELSKRVRAEVKPETLIVRVTVSDSDPHQAQDIANVEAKELVKFLAELEKPSTSDASQILPTVTDPASFNPNPVSPRTALNVIVALLMGLLVGGSVALARDLLDQSVKTAEDVEAASGVPLMAGINDDPLVQKSPLITDLATFSPRAESFRLLRTNLQFLDLDNPPRSIVITSAISGEGKTTAATNLAAALAQAGRRVLLVDGDLRRPRVAQVLGLEGSIGLTTVLVGRTKLEDSVQKHAGSGVYVLTSGPTPPNPSEILQAKATHELLNTLRESYDMVIIDAPPLLPVADAAILATAADGAIIITRHGKTNKEQLRGAAQRLHKVGARTFGVVLNMVPKRFGDMNYYYYYYAESSPKDGKRAAGGQRSNKKASK
jgi:capsular exopolysaccharide synthesis family protein